MGLTTSITGRDFAQMSDLLVAEVNNRTGGYIYGSEWTPAQQFDELLEAQKSIFFPWYDLYLAQWRNIWWYSLRLGELTIPYRYRQLKKATLEQEKCARASICILSVPHSEFFSLLRQQNDRLESWFCSKFQHMGYKQRWCNWCSRGRQKMININVKKSTCDIWSKERIIWISNCVNTCMPICFSLSSNPILRSFVICVSVFNVSDY